MKKETYDITGMSCAACSARIEKGISGMEGMQQCSVNLLKNSMTVSYDEAELDSGKIIHQVEDIGYGASLHQTQGSKTTGASGRGKNGATDAAAAAAKQMKQRLIVSLVFTIPLFYISMGHMAGWPLPSWLLGARNHMIFAFTQFLLVLPVLSPLHPGYVRIRRLVFVKPNSFVPCAVTWVMFSIQIEEYSKI